MIKKGALFLIIFLLLAVTVSAEKIDISSSKIQSKIFPGGEATFLLKVRNNQLRDEIIKVSNDPFSVYPFSEFIETISIKPSQLSIGSGQEGIFEVSIKYPKGIKSEKLYTALIIVSSLLNKDVKETYPLTSFIMSSSDIISMKVNIGDFVTTGKETNFDVNFKNNVDESFDNLKLYITFGSFSEEYSLSIKEKGEVNKEFKLNVKPDIAPGDYGLVLRLFQGQSLKGEKETLVKVVSTKELEEKITTTDGFLSSKVIITKINKGNERYEKIVKYPISSFQKLFTEATPKPTVAKENNKNYFVWNLNISPGEEINIIVTTDYTSLFFIIFGLILILSLVYYIKNKSLRITKKVIMVKDHDKMHFKVILTLENYTSKAIYNLKVIDLLPSLIRHYKDFGTLEPKNIQQGSKGLRFIWELSKLESGEERMISYKIEPQLNVFGNIKLPRASLQFAGKNNKLIIRKSNVATFKLNKQ